MADDVHLPIETVFHEPPVVQDQVQDVVHGVQPARFAVAGVFWRDDMAASRQPREDRRFAGMAFEPVQVEEPALLPVPSRP
jgi:hypothetical protein